MEELPAIGLIYYCHRKIGVDGGWCGGVPGSHEAKIRGGGNTVHVVFKYLAIL